MRTIHKYPMSFATQQKIEIHGFADIISLQMQNGVPCLWAMVDTKNEKIPVNFRVYGTGQEIPINLKLKPIGSVQCGEYVWHVFIDDTIVAFSTYLCKERI